ncbi:hypothetical protein ZIOFF_026869 [Zingiber officinale]|uniref:Uncharacterized protein n=1 Tax=Zingiber officinale TaxID=94328 RepID=A0A8J5HH63_ZINOF|nr:hypothetical protein ZIOFF_026869 [Zingiber officinale]
MEKVRANASSSDPIMPAEESSQKGSPWSLERFQDLMQAVRPQWQVYEDTLVHKVKDQVLVAYEHPVETCAVAVGVGLLLLRGPRRILYRNTLGRFKTEEESRNVYSIVAVCCLVATKLRKDSSDRVCLGSLVNLLLSSQGASRFVCEIRMKRDIGSACGAYAGHDSCAMQDHDETMQSGYHVPTLQLQFANCGGDAFCYAINLEKRLTEAELHLRDINESISKLKKQSKNILTKISFGEEDLQRGSTKIRPKLLCRAAGHEIQRLSKYIYKVESQATDLMEDLRAVPGRKALELRAEASI